MNIMFFITGLGMGGAERQVVDLADRMSARGHNVVIAYLTGKQEVLPGEPRVSVVALNGDKTLRGMVRAINNLIKLIRRFKPDVLHSHMVHANLIARVIRFVIKIPKLICTAHSSNEGGKLKMLAYRLTDFLADVTTNVSQEAVDILIAKGASSAGRMIFVPNGIDTERYVFDEQVRDQVRARESIDSSIKVILAVGRLVEAKNYPCLLDAFKLISQDDENVRLWIVGDGPLATDLALRVNEAHLDEKIKFFGRRNDVPSFYCAADVYVLSSAWEGFGLVVAEAMSCKTLVVATDCGGVKEVLGGSGYLVEPFNPEALRQSIKLALSLPPEEKNSLVTSARSRVVDNFSIDSVISTWERLYTQPESS
ncbi:Poly(glycerol-phosphate) alpha-glucosyltransferase [Pseudomonas sp. R4-35-07]|uniref:glycosyltransferase n=1 Tax=Pseudomonas sp. R4-35-07 TaxID=658643 RepID=UPI000F576719|nr:glycosyltransferase [Pseudomonas sp. R4-35-07]AZF31107.1 Poly(glycerol-phosphate) alpha-glucosyltransferase [Pseudomonas sp. R4-35-07]